jgi:hypothetical protein
MPDPLKFPSSPEGKRLLRAREECRKVTEQVKQLTEEIRTKSKGSIVYPLYANEDYVKTSKEFESAYRAYYMATGDESQLWFPPIPREKWGTFQKSVEKHFGTIAHDLNSKLVKILPWIYGFATAHAVVILEAVHLERGIPVTLFVTLRQRKPSEKVEFSDEIGYEDVGVGCSIGLESIVRFQNPDGLKNRQNSNGEEISDEALKYRAELLLKYGKSFLTDSNADWTGQREHLRQQKKKLLTEKPWLKNIVVIKPSIRPR